MRIAVALALGCGSLLLGCASGAPERRPAQSPVSEVATAADQAAQVDRLDEINRLCQRKAGIAVPRCWNDEYMRTGKKFEAQVTLMLVVGAGGQAEEVKVIASTAKSKELEKCLVDEARAWSYPDGKAKATVNCGFFLRSSM